MIVSLIGAVSDNNVIGKDNWMPWDLPGDLMHFRTVTRGKPIIMGRKTYDTIAAKGRAPLPGRHNIVVSRNACLELPGADVVSSVEEAIDLARKDNQDEIFVIGGEQIYGAALPLADRIYLTRVHTEVEGGEAFFPEYRENEWSLDSSEKHPADQENNVPFTINVYNRKSA